VDDQEWYFLNEGSRASPVTGRITMIILNVAGTAIYVCMRMTICC
jgi:hypothetical protein